MVKKKIVDNDIESVRKIIGNENVVIGTKKSLENAKKGRVKRAFISSNCPEEVKKDFEYYKSLSDYPIIYLNIPNEELGALYKKPFSISVLCETKE